MSDPRNGFSQFIAQPIYTCSHCPWERGRLAREDAMRRKKALSSVGGLPQV